MDRGIKVLKELAAQSEKAVDAAERVKNFWEAEVKEKEGRLTSGLFLVYGNLLHPEMQASAADLMKAAQQFIEANAVYKTRLDAHSKLAMALSLLTEGEGPS